MKFRVFTRKIAVVVNVIAIVFFELAVIAPYLEPSKWWFISVLGLVFPFLLLIVIIFLIGWLILLKPRYAILSAVALLIGYKSIGVFFAFKLSSKYKQEKEAGSLRIVSWNVARFIEMKRNNNKGSQLRLQMMDLIKKQDADILCMQEFFHSYDTTYYPNIDYIRENFNYPYWVYSHDIDGDKHFTGGIIFSRFPIIDSGMIRYPRPTLPDALLHADIKIGNDTIRVYTTHLQSLQFGKKDYERLDQIASVKDSLVMNSRTIFSKIKRGITNRGIQARIIHQVVQDSPYPVLFTADLNDVPNSYTYFTVRGGMQDAFLKKGFGIGRTFSALSPTLRIDYIFADHHFKVKQFNRIVRKYSDHYLIVADVNLRQPNPVK